MKTVREYETTAQVKETTLDPNFICLEIQMDGKTIYHNHVPNPAAIPKWVVGHTTKAPMDKIHYRVMRASRVAGQLKEFRTTYQDGEGI